MILFFFTFRLVAWFPLAEFKVKALPRNLRKTNKQEDQLNFIFSTVLLEVYVYSRERRLVLILKNREIYKMIDHHTRLKENEDLSL